jgi:hypothetical protein
MPKFAANLTMLWNELDFVDRFGAAAKAGFKAIEYLFPYAYPKEQPAEQLAVHKLTQVLHNLPAGDWAKGERGIACLPDRVGEFQDSVGRDRLRNRTLVQARQLPCRHRAARGRRRHAARDVRREPRFRRSEARVGGDSPCHRADQHARHPGLLPEAFEAGDRPDRRRRFGQSIVAVRHLPHADHGR